MKPNPQEIVYSGLATGLTISAVDGTAFVDNLPADIATTYADGTHELLIYDATSKLDKGTMKAVSTETLDATNLVTGWTNVNYDSFEPTGADLHAEHSTTGTQTGTSNSMVTTVGKHYKLVATWTNDSGQAPTLTGTNGFPTSLLAAGANNIYFTATGTSVVITVTNTAAAHWTCTFVLKQVTAPSADGSTIVSQKAGTTYNWTAKNASFTYNEASYSIQIGKLRGPAIVASYSVAAGDLLADLTTANSFIAPLQGDHSTPVDLSAFQDGNHMIRLFSGTTLYAEAHISATAPGGETLDVEGLTNGDFASAEPPGTAWTKHSTTISGGALNIVGGNDASQVPVNITNGGLFYFSGAGTLVSGSGLLQDTSRWYGNPFGQTINLLSGSGSIATYATVANANDRVELYATGGVWTVESLSFKRITDVATTGALLLSTPGGSRGYAYKHGSFTGNAAYTLQILRR